MKAKRILAAVLVWAMTLSFFPEFTFAVSADTVTFEALDGTAGANENEGFEKLVDGKKTEEDGTKWGVNYFSGAYIVIKASKPVCLSGYTFITGDDNETSTGRNPKDWVLYGSNDYNEADKTATWTAVHTVTGDTTMEDKNYASYSFDIADNNAAYRYYKLNIIATRGRDFMQLSEMELHCKDITFVAVDGTNNSKTEENYDKIADGSTATKWCYSVSNSPYVIIKASDYVCLSGYTFVTANDKHRNRQKSKRLETLRLQRL